jgi:hypothetical protein
MGAMRRKIANQLARFPPQHGDPGTLWERHLRRIGEGILQRLDAGTVRRAHHGGRGLRFWLPAVLERFGDARHFVAAGREPIEAGLGSSVVPLDDPLRTLRAFPAASLDLVSILWPADRPTGDTQAGLEAWIAAAHPPLRPGGRVVVCASRDGSPEAPLLALRDILREEDPPREVRAGSLPRDEDALRALLARAGFGCLRVWREGISLAFSDPSRAVEHFLDLGGEELLAGPGAPRDPLRVRARLAERLAEWYQDMGGVALTFEALAAIGTKPGDGT